MTVPWPDQELVAYLNDPDRRATELDVLTTNLEALPPWSEVHQEAMRFQSYMDGLYATADCWVADLYAEEDRLAALNDREYVRAMASREQLRDAFAGMAEG